MRVPIATVIVAKSKEEPIQAFDVVNLGTAAGGFALDPAMRFVGGGQLRWG